MLSHLAIWPGMYVGSGVAFVAQVAPASSSPTAVGIGRWWAVLVFAFLTGVGTYLLDRVKLRDSWLDPADREAHPSRYGFIAGHSRAVRVLAFGCLGGAVVVAWARASQHWLLGIPVASAIGVVVYAARPRRVRARLKDLLIVKNAYVAGGISAFAVVVVWCWFHAGVARLGEVWAVLVFAAGALFVRVFADAVLCDLDDEAADRRFGTSTLPTMIGHRRAWDGAMLLRLGLALGLIVTPIGPERARVAWGVVTAVSSVGLRVARPRKLRDWVDLRFALEAMAVAMVLSLG